MFYLKQRDKPHQKLESYRYVQNKIKTGRKFTLSCSNTNSINLIQVQKSSNGNTVNSKLSTLMTTRLLIWSNSMKSVSSLNNKLSTPFNGHRQEHLPTKKQHIQMNGVNVYAGS